MPCKSNCINGVFQTDQMRMKRRFDTRSTAPVRDKYPWPRKHDDESIPLFDHFEDTHKAAKSLACRNRAIEDTCDDYDSIFSNEWLKVSIEPTRFVDPDRTSRAPSGSRKTATGASGMRTARTW
ncbi:hypothetical protein F2Q70_00012033 [Brassica cretica]|uniref:Uncharacterized protein n=1 Tax=Brassica cretica TaxID=69181 RepID=A0A3N6PST9_BRACR|nr:hypothetical protein F2Q70_00012033 [Brassica cretica]KAF3552175.1 hypothetical protein DY000_02007771 [Brassica cretica]